MATFMVNGPPSAPLMAVGAAFYGSEEGAVDDAMDEMDTDHFNELDKIFDLPYPADGNDPFAPPGASGSSSGSSGSSGSAAAAGAGAAGTSVRGMGAGGSSSAGVNAAASMMVQPPYLQSHRMNWSREEDASYHTAVDATCHSTVDNSYHHVDGSMHSHSVVDASMHSHSVMDASGHDSLADYSQHGDYDYGKGEPRFMEHSCEACKRSKKRCNRRNPCQICTARGIKCVPQVRGPGRPPGSKSNRGSSSSTSSLASSSSRRGGGGSSSDGRGVLSSATAMGAPNNSSHGPSPLTRTNSGAGLAQSHGTTDSERSSSAGSSSSSSSGGGRGGRSLRGPPPRDPWHCRFFFEAARHCKEAFLKAWHENELDTAKCILIRNMWAKTATRFPPGVDITFGISDQVQEAVGPPPPASAPPATSPATRSKSHAAQLAKELTHPGRDEMGTWCLPEELRKLDDGCSLLCGYMHMQDETLVYTDEKFAATFMGREEVASKVESLAVLPILLLAEIFHPDDLPDVYAAIGAHWFRKRRPLPPGDELAPEDCTGGLALQGEASWICKCVDKRNNEFLALVRFRSFAAPPDGYPGAALLAIRPLLASKYLLGEGDLHSAAAFRPASVRRPLRDTLGALPTHMEHEHGEYETGDAAFRPLRRGTTVLSAEAGGPKPVPGPAALAAAALAAAPSSLHRLAVGSAPAQQQHLGGSLHGGAPHQGGMSWGGLGVGERQHQHQHQEQRQGQGQGQAHLFHLGGGGGGLADAGMDTSHESPGGGLDASRGPGEGRVSFASSSAPQQQQPAQLTEAQMFLLQGGPLTIGGQPLRRRDGEEEVEEEGGGGLPPPQLAMPTLTMHHSAPSALHGPRGAHQVSVSPDDLQVGLRLQGEGEDGDGVSSVGTDYEQYGSSPSPEPHMLHHQQHQHGQHLHHHHHHHQQQQQQQQQALHLSHSRSSPALGGWKPQTQQRASQQQHAEHQHQHQQQHPRLGMPRPILHAQVSDDVPPAPLAGRVSHLSMSGNDHGNEANEANDLDVSCHGPADPNGYGGLQWTPAPLNHLIGAIGGLVGAAKKSIGGSGSGSGSAAAAVTTGRPPSPSSKQEGAAAGCADLCRSL